MKKRLRKELGAKLHSVVLYGSVARGEATEQSDIDFFLVIESNELYDKALDISYEMDLETGTLTAIFWTTPEELEKYLKSGSPFLSNVVEEGELLYDDGTFETVRSRLFKSGRAVPASS